MLYAIHDQSKMMLWLLHIYYETFASSRAYKHFRDVVESKFLMKDIGTLSPLHQTHGLEVFHNVINTLDPKSTHFFYPAMLAR